MSFAFGKASIKNMKGIRDDLKFLAQETIKMSPMDMTVLATGGLRTASMQMALYKSGASKLNGRSVLSKHQKQADGFGWAIDLVPYYLGDPRWEWPLIYPIAACMAFLSIKHDTPLRWGGVWDRKMSEYIDPRASIDQMALQIKAEVNAYCIRHPGPDFIDGPHYELLS